VRCKIYHHQSIDDGRNREVAVRLDDHVTEHAGSHDSLVAFEQPVCWLPYVQVSVLECFYITDGEG
jgi:hypothetical protein